MSEPVSKKRRTSRTPSPLPGPSSTNLDENTLTAPIPGGEASVASVKPTEELPDEEHGAPPSSAAGAHAKPLSALFNSGENIIARYSPKKKAAASKKDLKGKGKENGEEEIPEDFTEMLARLKEGGQSCFRSRMIFFCD